MAKPAVPGRVKTRLMDALSAQQAAEVHAAMMTCVLRRVAPLASPGRAVLALASLGAEDRPVTDAELEAARTGWSVMDQGRGDLGQRLGHVWRAIGGGPVAFFGIDSPDVPAVALGSIRPALAEADAAVGPTGDGGYWTLAARRYAPALLEGIDWGGPGVYDQTVSAARGAGLRLAPLPGWFDVDDPADLEALRARLAGAGPEPAASDGPDASLRRLEQRLTQTCGTPNP